MSHPKPSTRQRAYVRLTIALTAIIVTMTAVYAFALTPAARSQASQPVAAIIAGSSDPAAETINDSDGDGHLRVLLVGDSLMVGARDSLVEQLEDRGIEVEFRGLSGTGLMTDQAWWIDEIEDSVTTFEPDVVVIESCCNYEGDFVLPDGSTVDADSDLMYAIWQFQAEQAVQAAESSGAQVYAVITPAATEDAFIAFPSDRIERFNDIYRGLGVPLIDWNAAVTDPSDPSVNISLHDEDGLHFTAEGYARLADATADAILQPAGAV